MKMPTKTSFNINLLLLLFMSVTLTACGGSSGSGAGSNSSNNFNKPISSSSLSVSSVTSSLSSSVSSSVSSVSSKVESSVSSSVSSSSVKSVDASAPSKPKNVKDESVSTTEIRISWAAASDNVGVTAYRVFRDGAYLGNTNAQTRRYTDKNLTPSMTYTYTVSAGDKAGNWSGLSSPLQLKTFAITGDITLSWFVPNRRVNGAYLELDELGGYEIRYKRASDAKYTSVIITEATTTSYKLGLLGVDNQFEIAAYDSNGLYSEFIAIAPR